MNETTTLKTCVCKNDYDFFIEYIGEILDAIYNPEENYGDYVSLAMKYYLETLEKHQEEIENHTYYFIKYPTEEMKKLEPVKITGVDTLELEKFKTYIHDKYGTLKPFLGLELSQALTIYLEDEFINLPWWDENTTPYAIKYYLEDEGEDEYPPEVYSL